MASPDIPRLLPEYTPVGLYILPNIQASSSKARHLISMEHWPPLTGSQIADATLAVSEFVGNVNRHTKSPNLIIGTGIIGVSEPYSVFIAVGNTGKIPDKLKAYSMPATAENHRGLYSVQEITSAWGAVANGEIKGPDNTESITQETVVWCRID